MGWGVWAEGGTDYGAGADRVRAITGLRRIRELSSSRFDLYRQIGHGLFSTFQHMKSPCSVEHITVYVLYVL